MAGRGVAGKGRGWQNWIAGRKGWLAEEGGCRRAWLQKYVAAEKGG
jgi:hypothetical protein